MRASRLRSARKPWKLRHATTTRPRLKSEIRSIVLLDTDRAGVIYFAVELHEEPSSDWVLLQCLEPLHGLPVGSAVLPAETMPEETFRDLTGHWPEPVTADDAGEAEFHCPAGSVSIWSAC